MNTLAVVCTLLVAILGISELPAFKRLEFLESDRGKKMRAGAIVGLLALGTLFQQTAQRASDDGRARAESSRDAMLAVVGQGVGALKAAEDGRVAAEAARAEAERERDEVQAADARRNARLDVSWSPLEGRRLEPANLSAAADVAGESIADRKEYLLAVSNPSEYVLTDVDMLFTFPYPVSSRDVSRTVDASGVAFEPEPVRLTAVPIGGGRVAVPPACTTAYVLMATELRPRGRAEVLVRLYSGRDPRGRGPIDDKQRMRFIVPDWGPDRTFVRGRYKYEVAGSRVTRQFYAPLELRDDKTVLMARPAPPPSSRKLYTSAALDFGDCR